VIFVGQRGAEQRHDPVAHHLVHRALVSVDGLHHALEYRVEQLAGLLEADRSATNILLLEEY
jgi:hypothetical protein